MKYLYNAVLAALFCLLSFHVASIDALTTSSAKKKEGTQGGALPLPSQLPKRPSQLRHLFYNPDTDTYHLPSSPRGTTATSHQQQYGDVLAAHFSVSSQGMTSVGWNPVYFESDRTFENNYGAQKAFYALGFAEGVTTAESIYHTYQNLYPPFNSFDEQFPGLIKNWTLFQVGYLREQIAKYGNNGNSGNHAQKYWSLVGNLLAQMDGLVAGYKAAVASSSSNSSTSPATVKDLSWLQIYAISFNFELFDVFLATEGAPWGPILSSSKAAAGAKTMAQQKVEVLYEKFMDRRRRAGLSPFASNAHCSALVRVTPTDLFMAHDTWTGFSSMLRQYKTYNTSYRTLSFSSYPGTLHSGDDWYILGNGLSVQETTNSNFNSDSYQYTSNTSVPEFMRVMLSNYLAADAPDWASLFCIENSGTYNNQWMILDHRLYNPTASSAEGQLPNNTFWVLEQFPNMCIARDESAHLRTEKYWASYNIPAFKEAYAYGGYNTLKSLFGSYWSHHSYARAEIFRRNQSQVADLDDMKAIMRYNDYLHDPLSLIPNCTGATNGVCSPPSNPSLAIASRYDLVSPNLTQANLGELYRFLGGQAFGAIDTKIVSWREFYGDHMSEGIELQGHVISGPTVQPESAIAPFCWSTTMYPTQTWGLPDCYDFQFINATALLSML